MKIRPPEEIVADEYVDFLTRKRSQFGQENAPMTNAKNGKPVEYPNMAEPKKLEQQKA